MAKLSTSEVKKMARELLAKNPSGMKFSTLFHAIENAAPETPNGTIRGSLHSLRVDHKEIEVPTKGLWLLAKSPDSAAQKLSSTSDAVRTASLSEAQFYNIFADWLCDDAEEAVEAMALGGSLFKSKWATPDVLAVNKPQKSDPVHFMPTEIVAAEIKIDGSQSVIAFGQACAYRLFAHKVYIVMPRGTPKDDFDRLEALCGSFGVGLVVFDLDIKAPNFMVMVRAQRFEPDRFYVNDIAERLRDHDPKSFNRLFA